MLPRTKRVIFGPAKWSLGRIVNVAANGDSHTAYGVFYNSVTETLQNRSFSSWLEMLMGWNYRHWKNYGVVGVKIADNTGYITNAGVGSGGPVYGAMNALSPAPDMIFQLCGHNDGAAARTLLQMQNDYQSLYDAYVANFSSATRLVQQPVMPATDSWEAIRLSLNSWLSSYIGTRNPNHRFLDANASITDPADSTSVNPLYNHGTGGADVIHLRPIGARAFAAAILPKLIALNLAPAPFGIYPYALDVASAATSDPTNILRRLGAGSNADTTQWQFAGTSGTKTNVTGSSPTGWTAAANVAWTTSAGSQPAVSVAADGTNLQAVTFTIPAGPAPSTAANTNISLTSNSITAVRLGEIGVTNGQEYRAGIRVDGTGLVGLTMIKLTATWSVNATSYFRTAEAQVSGTTQVATDDLGATIGVDLLMPEFLIPAGAIVLTSLSFTLAFVPSATAGGSITIKRPYLRPLAYLPSWP